LGLRSSTWSWKSSGAIIIPARTSGTASGVPGKYGVISLKGNEKTDFKFTFVKTKPNVEIQVKEFAFTFCDFDFSSPWFESLESSDMDGYVTEEDTILEATSAVGQPTVFENTGKIAQAISGPNEDPMNLAPLERRASVMLFFKNKSSFRISWGIKPYGAGGSKILGLQFMTTSSLIDHCTP